MKINLLMQLLELEIQENMNKFINLGIEAKKRINLGQSAQDIVQIYTDMAEIYEALKPVEKIIRDQNPRLLNLFDSLMELKKNLGQ